MNLPDALLEQVKQRADASGRTVTSIVEEALRELLARPSATTTDPLELPTFGSPTDRVLVDILDKDALGQVLDEPR